jgi:hypothetical protein
MNQKYKPIKSDKPDKKYYIITKDNKKIYFGDSRYQHFTNGHLDWDRRQRYQDRHKKNEDWNNPDTRAYWSYSFLWKYPTYVEAYDNIQRDLRSRGYLQ